MKVRELLDSEDKWTQEAIARNKNKEIVDYNSPDAVRWCLLGAIFKCYETEANKILNEIGDKGGIFIRRFNDSHTYEEVMELVRRLDI